jgi:MOSC domain-containing protein YiiM
MADTFQVVAVLTGPVVLRRDLRPGQAVASGVEKRPRRGRVPLGPVGLDGDAQADTRHHGGPAKAVLMMAEATRRAWPALLPGFAPEPGAFGENLLAAGVDEDAVCLGDRWTGPDAVLTVTQPRRPCWKPGARAGQPGLAPLMARHGATGWYLAVERSGSIAAGDAFRLDHRPHPGWSIRAANRVLHGDDPALVAAWLAAPPAGLDRWIPALAQRADRLRRGEAPPPDPAWSPS